MKRTFRQLIIFTLIGCLSAVVDFGVYLFLTRFIPFFNGRYVLATLVSAPVALVVAFYNNRRWTFQARHLKGSRFYTRFYGVYLISILWQTLLLHAFIQLGLLDWLAKPLAILVVAYGWNFLLSKYWVFRYA